MKVLVAGATGPIGNRLIPALLAAGHEVVGIAGSESGLAALNQTGAEGVIANALDSHALDAVAKQVKPEAVVRARRRRRSDWPYVKSRQLI